MTFSFQKAFYVIACSIGFFIILYFGRPLLATLSIALLASFILYPVCTKIESWGVGRVLATFICLLAVTFVMAGVIFLFSHQIVNLVDDFSDFENKLGKLVDSIISYSNEHVAILPTIDQEMLLEKGQKIMAESGGVIVSGTVNQTLTTLSGALMTIVYTFLLLIYRSGLRHAIQQFAVEENRSKVGEMIDNMQSVGKHYLFGLSIMILILGSANSLVLFIFGIDHPLFFGFMAGLLAVIPYVGTTIGAGVPVLYSLMTNDSLLIPLGLILCFWGIQLIESNYLSPKIVGGNLNMNALATILSLIVGGYLWGIVGMALFLPLTAIFKVFCDYYDPLKPVGLLLGSQIDGKDFPGSHFSTKK